MTNKKAVQGIALIEVLIAIFVLAIGILGAGAMQTIGLQANQGAYLRSQAMYLASDMMDRIRENRAARSSYIGKDTDNAAVQALTAPDCSVTAGCSPANVATADIVAWVDRIERGNILPNGRGQIEALASGDNIRITITWGETDWSNGVRQDTTQSYVVTAAVNSGVL